MRSSEVPTAPPHDWPHKLEQLLLRELLKTWNQLNVTYFKEALCSPAMELSAAEGFLGRWMRDHRTISFSRSFVRSERWGSVVEVLKHEMAHQYADEVLHASDEAPHGAAFRSVCERLGIDPRARGIPAAVTHDPLVDKIARLLALSASPNQHEAEAAAIAAQRLMAKYNVDHPADSRFVFRQLGRVTGRVEEHERILAMILHRHFFVEVIWVPAFRPEEGKRGSVLEICGTSENTAIAEYVHAYLSRVADELWVEHRVKQASSSNRERRTFLAGVLTGFLDKLTKESGRRYGEGLVWIKSPELESYFRKRHPYIRNVRHGGRERSDAFGRGREAGRGIVLRRGVGASTGPVRMLTGGAK